MKIHFIGIGGIGLSALAQYYLEKGHSLSGSDLASSEMTDLLKEKGAKLLLGRHKAENLSKNADLVIYSPAVTFDNPELKEAKKLGIKTQSYPEALGDLTKKCFTIAVSGTHGKSTTTAMISLVLIKAGLDPTVIIGTKLKEFGNTNFRAGESDYLIIEADEWQASFLNYWPKIIVLTNIEKEHLDYYKDLNHILRTYREYISHLPEDGILVANKDDKNIAKIIDNNFLPVGKKLLYFNRGQKEANEIRKILKLPGEHNLYNALATLTVARILKIPDKVSLKTLSEYRGSWRRFEIIKGKVDGRKITIISDYGHHPTEIKSTLEAVRQKFPKQKVWCVYQPHQYQRTFYLFKEFVKVFSSVPVDNLIITDIYDVAGREERGVSVKISSKRLVESINKPGITYLTKEKISPFLRENLKDGDVLIIMGAGDIYKLVNQLV